MSGKDYIYLTIIAVLVVINFISGPTSPADESGKVAELKATNDSLLNSIKERENNVQSIESRIDTLIVFKTKTKLVYEKIYEKNNILPVDSVVADFNRIFAKAGIND